MAVQSRRGRILEALQKQLRTITTDNGYANNVNEVTMTVRNWRDRPAAETPVLFVVDQRSSYGYNASKLIEASMFVDIFGYLRDKTPEEMEEMIADIEDCLDKNQTLSFDGERNLVNYHKIVDVITDSQMFSEIEGSQLFCVKLEIKYTRCIGNAR